MVYIVVADPLNREELSDAMVTVLLRNEHECR